MPFITAVETYLPPTPALGASSGGTVDFPMRQRVAAHGGPDRLDDAAHMRLNTTPVAWASPVNSSADLKPKGDPPSALGVAQCVELFKQLRRDAVNHLDGARIAVAHKLGGRPAGSAVTTLEGPGTYGG